MFSPALSNTALYFHLEVIIYSIAMYRGVLVLSLLGQVAFARLDPEALPVGCDYAATKKDCFVVDGCSWCASASFSGQQSVCVDEKQAKNLPRWIYNCTYKKLSAPGEELVTVSNQHEDVCEDLRTKANCTASASCVWCKGRARERQPGHCMDAEQAKYIPKEWVTCTKPKAPEVDTVTAGKAAGGDPMDCMKAKDKTGCLKSTDCSWCTNLINPEGLGSVCTDVDHAKLFPQSMFKCKAGKEAADPAMQSANPSMNPTPAGDSCLDADDKEDCKDMDGCAWCENQIIPDTGSRCINVEQAKFIPESVFECKVGNTLAHDTSVPQAGAMCIQAMGKKACLKNAGCSWCTSSFDSSGLAGQCMDEMAAKYLPGTAYKCKAADTKEVANRNGDGAGFVESVAVVSKAIGSALSTSDAPSAYAPPSPGGGDMGCQSAMDKHDCLNEKECYWCDNKFTPGMGSLCMDEMQAKFLPDMVFKCKKGKHHKKGKGGKGGKKRKAGDDKGKGGDDKHHRNIVV